MLLPDFQTSHDCECIIRISTELPVAIKLNWVGLKSCFYWKNCQRFHHQRLWRSDSKQRPWGKYIPALIAEEFHNSIFLISQYYPRSKENYFTYEWLLSGWPDPSNFLEHQNF